MKTHTLSNLILLVHYMIQVSIQAASYSHSLNIPGIDTSAVGNKCQFQRSSDTLGFLTSSSKFTILKFDPDGTGSYSKIDPNLPASTIITSFVVSRTTTIQNEIFVLSTSTGDLLLIDPFLVGTTQYHFKTFTWTSHGILQIDQIKRNSNFVGALSNDQATITIWNMNRNDLSTSPVITFSKESDQSDIFRISGTDSKRAFYTFHTNGQLCLINYQDTSNILKDCLDNMIDQSKLGQSKSLMYSMMIANKVDFKMYFITGNQNNFKYLTKAKIENTQNHDLESAFDSIATMVDDDSAVYVVFRTKPSIIQESIIQA